MIPAFDFSFLFADSDIVGGEASGGDCGGSSGGTADECSGCDPLDAGCACAEICTSGALSGVSIGKRGFVRHGANFTPIFHSGARLITPHQRASFLGSSNRRAQRAICFASRAARSASQTTRSSRAASAKCRMSGGLPSAPRRRPLRSGCVSLNASLRSPFHCSRSPPQTEA